MKRLRQICAATVFTIILINGASASGEGIMQPWYVPTPTPTPPSATTIIYPDFNATGEVEPKNEDTTSNLATEIMLRLIQSMLPLF